MPGTVSSYLLPANGDMNINTQTDYTMVRGITFTYILWHTRSTHDSGIIVPNGNLNWTKQCSKSWNHDPIIRYIIQVAKHEPIELSAIKARR